MSGIVILAPALIAPAWPALVSAAGAVMVAMGFTAVDQAVKATQEAKVDSQVANEVEIDVKNVEEVGATLGREEELVFTRDGISVRFSRDVRGRLKVCVSGEEHSKTELEELGRTVAGKVVQQYVYNRLIEEMKSRENMELVDQSIDDDENIHIKLRSWED